MRAARRRGRQIYAMAKEFLINLYLRVNQSIWTRLPNAVRNSQLGYWHGLLAHRLVRGRAKRQQYFGTFFLRNRPELELIRRLCGARPEGSALRVAVLGCSIGAEVYSVLWTIRSARKDLRIRTCAVDISPMILSVAEKAVYTSESSGLVGASIFERLSESEKHAIFDWAGETATVKDWIREGISWRLGDVGDSAIIDALGPQDIVMASNFLCHMDPAAAESCLRNIVRLVDRNGYLFVLGVDLEIREKVARELGLQPVPDLLREIHDGDPIVRRDWPWNWWGLEPLNDRRRDWQLRYAVAYRVT